MKTKRISKKLMLSKKTIANLGIGNMGYIQAGKDAPPEPVPESVLWDICTGGTSCVCTGPTGNINCPACPTC